jgi:hypothetical protein
MDRSDGVGEIGFLTRPSAKLLPLDKVTASPPSAPRRCGIVTPSLRRGRADIHHVATFGLQPQVL